MLIKSGVSREAGMEYRTDKKRHGKLPVVVSLLLLALSAAVFEFFGVLTKYIPLCLTSAICFYQALVNSVLFAAGSGDGKKEPPRRTENSGSGRLHRAASSVSFTLRQAAYAAGTYIGKRLNLIAVGLIIIITLLTQLNFFILTRRLTSLTSVGYAVPVVLLAFFLLFIAAEKWCKHTETKDKRISVLLRNLRGALLTGRISLLFTMIAVVIKLLGYYDAQKWLVWALYALFIYASVFIILSLAVQLLKKELLTNPKINIPLPFAGGADRDLGVLNYLEENTGITMRSLFSLRLVKTILPYTILIAAALFWAATGVVQVESYQTGGVYRFGKLRDVLLEPGIHLTLPWPIDKTVIYNTESVSKMTIGYRSSTDTDNTWTGSHGSSEYKLLLGGGDELVSINLRIEYKISDLKTYLTNSASPEKLLEALAYELVTDRTINTDLEDLLSVDRSAFSEDFKNELERNLGKYKAGLEVVSVVLESIHPPVEVAPIYQQIISAEIEADKYLLDAAAKAAVALADANTKYDTALSVANAAYYTKTAEAKAGVAQFMASVAADNAASDAYRYYKYLSAIGTAYGKSRLVIVGDGIDSSNLYFGSITLSQ